ncbi:MAG: M1 family metallopeptidase [Bacteroidota bacterium]|nr:M1 family metallopeptidase [Bacteroidota bacterium]
MKRAFAGMVMTLMTVSISYAQENWQQSVEYTMDVTLDVRKHQFDGTQTLIYTNHSPDTLDQVFYHLYFNAFQPGSSMDIRSRTISDPDKRVGDRIQGLSADEIGYQRITKLTMNGQGTNYKVVGTVLQVELPEPLLPRSEATFEMEFNGQVPLQIRRSGRDNKEGIDYSMSQWYPKMAAYDEDGWHPDQYIAREFYAPFGSFDVTIHIDRDYKIGGTGTLVNAEEIGWNYSDDPELKRTKERLRSWHFKADRVHDFAWAADPEFTHLKTTLNSGMILHLIYGPTAYEDNWLQLPEYADKFFTIMNRRFGKYPYPQFSVIQAGDGGMEYPMCTFVLGGGDDLKGFVGLFAHETAHNWYYGVLASNENRYPWMDEGFTTFAEEIAMAEMFQSKAIHPFLGTNQLFAYRMANDLMEPLSTPADHYDRNRGYSINSYGMGSLFLNQLRYVVGEEAFWKGMKMYFNQWKFNHPDPKDFIRVMERASGIQLDWYLIYFTELSKPIDYAIDKLEQDKGPQEGSVITLRRVGTFPMPVDVEVRLRNGNSVTYTIPLAMMYGTKKGDLLGAPEPWFWTNPIFELRVPYSPMEIKSAIIDPNAFTLDIDRENNLYTDEVRAPDAPVEEKVGD